MGQVLGGNAHAIVADGEYDLVLFLVHADIDLATTACELDGIGQQVAHYFLHVVNREYADDRCLVGGVLQLDVLLPGQFLVALYQHVHVGAQVAYRSLWFADGRLHLRDVEHLVDE